MAWQLIYTSAPRLLEAGRSGFGTVARHRAIHPILAAALERDSQFDRSAVRGRVVFAHRIVAAGGSRFHVLSCIRETGADYTGRTNHIAHHLIIDPREVSLLGIAAPTPVDICRGMSWRTAWPDAPKWLDASEEISLTQFHSATTPGGAWQAIAGDARYAGVLRPATSSVLIVPPDADALALFAESLTAAASQAWQATFNNCIQPTDDLSEFRWIAVEAASALRERAVGGRTILDLTAPETLPAPPESRSKLFIPAPDAVLPAPSSLAQKSAKPVGNLFDAQLAAHAPRAQKGHRRKSGLLPYIVVLVLLAAGAAYWGFPLVAEAPELTAQRTKIREDVKAAFNGSGIEEAEALAKARPEQLRAALAIAEAARKTHDALQNHPIGEFSAKAEDARELAKKVSLNIPNSVGQLFDLHSAQWGFRQRTQRIRDATLKSDQLTELESLWTDVNLDSKTLASEQAKLLSEKTKKSVELLWAERLLAMLETDASPTEKADWFDKQLNSHLAALAKSEPAHTKSQFATSAKKLIEDWKAVEAAESNSDKISGLVKIEAEKWPVWLQEKANKQLGKMTPVEHVTAAEVGAPAVAVPLASKSFEGELIIVTNPTAPNDWTAFAKELDAGNYKLYKDKDKDPIPLSGNDSGKFRFQNLTGGDPLFSFVKNGVSFQTDKAPPAAPYELRLERGEKTVIRAWVSDRKTPFRSVEGGLARVGDEIQVRDSLAASLCQLAQRRGWALTLTSADWSAAMVGDGKASIAPKLEALKNDIKKLEGDLKKLMDVRDKNAFPDKLKNAIKDMEKYASECFKKPKKVEEVKKIKDDEQRKKAENEIKQYENAVPPKPTEASSMGEFLVLASDGPPRIDKFYEIGDELKKGAGKKDVESILPKALSEIDGVEKELKKREQVRTGGNENENNAIQKDRDQAKVELARLTRLRAFIEAIKKLPEDRKTEAGKIAGIETKIKEAEGNSLLKPELPPGIYTIFAKLPMNANPLPFIRFTIKPQ